MVRTVASTAAMLMITAGAAFAQSAPKVSFLPAATPPPVTAPAGTTVAQSAPDSYWELIGGVEFDTDGLFYGAIGPWWNKRVGDNVRLVAGASFNWLQYEFDESGGTTRVNGPGITPMAGLRFGDRNTFKVMAGPSFRWENETFIDAGGNETEIEGGDNDGMEVGLSVSADAYLNPTDVDNVHLLANFNTASDWLWTRAGYKRQISNFDWQGTWAHFLGAEAIMQGNDDIRIWMFGGLFEFTHAPSSTSIALRAGYKRSTFEAGDDRTGPYFGLNFYKRLGSR